VGGGDRRADKGSSPEEEWRLSNKSESIKGSQAGKRNLVSLRNSSAIEKEGELRSRGTSQSATETAASGKERQE